MIFTAKSILLFPGFNEDTTSNELSDQIILPSYYLNRLIDEYSPSESVYLAEIINIENNNSFIVSVGTPHLEDKTIVFVPDWILTQLGTNNEVTIRIKKLNRGLPVATKLVIKPLDRVAFDTDITKCFESALINLHVLHEGITVPIRIPEMGGYEFYAHIEKVEPEAVSKVVNGEVEVDFIRDFDDDDPVATPNPVPILNEDNSTKIEELPKEDISLEERRKRIRESWAKKF